MNDPLQSRFDFMTPNLPNATTVLVLGIISIVSCWCFGIIGLIFGIIALVMANRAGNEYIRNFGKYSETSYKNLQAGKICAIIGVCLSGIFLIYMIVYCFIVGAIFSFIPWSDMLKSV